MIATTGRQILHADTRDAKIWQVAEPRVHKGVHDQNDASALEEFRESMNYYETLIEVADDCPAAEGQVPQARGGKKTKAVVEYEMLVKHPYKYSEEDIAFETYAVLHDIPKAIRPKERKKFLSKGHPHLRVSALPKRYGWGIHNNAEGKIALVAVESPEYERLVNDPRTAKIKAFRSTRA